MSISIANVFTAFMDNLDAYAQFGSQEETWIEKTAMKSVIWRFSVMLRIEA